MKKLNTIKSIAVLSAALLVLSGLAGCGVGASAAEAEPAETTLCEVEEFGYCVESYPQFYVGSDSLVDGVWSEDMANVAEHRFECVSPSLYWEPVEGAACYVIYMVDSTHSEGIPPMNLLHWIVENYEGTEIEADADDYFLALDPERGTTRTYQIYVIALKAPVERAKGSVGTMPTDFGKFLEALDTDADGNTGNIIAFGFLSGTYTKD
ncbi:MAG: hypothetical protein K6F45_09280 [Saccharofermentans sp.]|nr:hypothetical protein [Saccharofermentans sp.]